MSATQADFEPVNQRYKEVFGYYMGIIQGMDPGDYDERIRLAIQAIDRGREFDEDDLFDGGLPDDVDL